MSKNALNPKITERVVVPLVGLCGGLSRSVRQNPLTVRARKPWSAVCGKVLRSVIFGVPLSPYKPI